jgi:hypothetical protein
MSDPEKGGSSIGASQLQIIVKGGTTSSAHDKERAKQKAMTELGREHQDKQQRAADLGAGMTKEGFVASRLTSLKMMDGGSPRLVLYYLNRDKSIRQECIAELVQTPDGDMMFTMVCPKCLERGEPHGSSQVMVRKSHRRWELDVARAGEVVPVYDPFHKQMMGIRICGVIEAGDEILRCTNLGCAWAVKISKSNVEEV